jgi:hypothetical protein
MTHETAESGAGPTGTPGAAGRSGPLPRAPEPKGPPRWSPGTVILIGALLTAGSVVLALHPRVTGSTASSASEPTLAALPAGELAAAMPTLDPATSQQPVAEAKSCKAPLAFVSVRKQPGTPGGMIRVRSGNYLSPAFNLTDAPQRIAIPYPAPYAAGRGALFVIGEASGVTIHLTPGWATQTLNGAAPINVVWTPGNPC